LFWGCGVIGLILGGFLSIRRTTVRRQEHEN
jgi:hypothetical protein